MKRILASLISVHRGLPLTAAVDVIDEVQRRIDNINYDCDYKFTTKEEILREYLGITEDYLYVFEGE